MRLLLALAVSLSLHVVLGVVSLVRSMRAPAVVVAAVKPPEVATRVTLFDVMKEPPLPLRGEGRGEGSRAPKRQVVLDAPAAPPEDDGVSHEENSAEENRPLTPTLSPQGERETSSPSSAPARIFDVTALHAALADSARRCYPPAAKRYGLAGEAQVELCLDAVGALTSTRIEKSTGQDLLDTAARECVVAGAMPLPKDAWGACYTVPVRFSR